MKRGELFVSSAILAIASLAGCGGGGDNPDALLVPVIDASPPDSSPPDAFVCTMDECPGNICTDFETDPEHCGDCDTACAAAEECSATGCACPTYDFVPAALPDGILTDMVPGYYVAFSILSGSTTNIVGIAYANPTDIIPGMPYTLDGSTLPATPFLVAGYDVDLAGMTARAAFAAVSGTVVFTRACSTGVSGTVTDVTFQGGTLFPPSVDPNGCTFTVPTITFDMGDGTGTDCTPPPA